MGIRRLIFTGIGSLGGAGAVYLLLMSNPIIGVAATVGLYLSAITAGGALGTFSHELIDEVQELLKKKPTILMIGISGVGKTTVIKEFQDASAQKKAEVVSTKVIGDNIIYVANKPYSIWDYAGQQPSQIIEVIDKFKAENNIVIIPLFVVDVFPSEDEIEEMEDVDKMPARGSLSISNDIVQKRIAQQEAELSNAFCQTILGSINRLSKIKSVGYLVNKVDLLDQESQNQVFQYELPALEYLKEISASSNFELCVEAGSALYGINVRKLLRYITKDI